MKIFLVFQIGIFYSQKIRPMMDCSYTSLIKSPLSKHYYNPDYSLSIESKYPEVFSLSNGKISKIMNDDNTYTIIIRTDDMFFVYSNLKFVPENLTVGQSIDKRNIIGGGSFLNDYYSIKIQIYKGINSVFNIEKYIKCKMK